MTTSDPFLDRLRGICLSFPGTKETFTWGHPNFRVGDKIFAGYEEHGGRPEVSFKLEKHHAMAIVQTPGFRVAPYTGRYGWVSLDLETVEDWDEVGDLVRESYSLIAPKRLVAQMAGASTK